MSRVAAALARFDSGAERGIVLDVGSGGGWAARYVGDADVIAVDLLAAGAGSAALHLRADMRSLPLRDHTVDAALYVASLHYAPLTDSIREAARVLRPGGALIALDSPMYHDRGAQARAARRSAEYYASAGFPELAEHYHPIDTGELRAALAARDVEVIRLDPGTGAEGWWQRLGRQRRPSFLLARTIPG